MRGRLLRRRGDQGFTLVELLVVMIIIGILAGIAIPIFFKQRQKAVDADLQSDLRTLALSEETYFTDNEAYLAVASTGTPVIVDTLQLSVGAAASVVLNSTGNAYCIRIASDKGSRPFVHISSKGGLQPKTTTTCPAASAY